MSERVPNKKTFELWLTYDGLQYTVNILSEDTKTWVYAIDEDYKKCITKAADIMATDKLEFINIVGVSDDIEY